MEKISKEIENIIGQIDNKEYREKLTKKYLAKELPASLTRHQVKEVLIEAGFTEAELKDNSSSGRALMMRNEESNYSNKIFKRKDITFPMENCIANGGLFLLQKQMVAIKGKNLTSSGSTGGNDLVQVERTLHYRAMKTLCIFLAIYANKMYTDKENFTKDNRRIHFTLSSICPLLGVTPAGANFDTIRRVILTLEFSKLSREIFYKDEEVEEIGKRRISLVIDSYNFNRRYKRRTVEKGYWIKLNPIFTNLIDQGQFTTHQLFTVLKIMNPIAFGLYFKLGTEFFKTGGKPLYRRYDSLCKYCKVDIKTEKLRIKKQFEPAFNELVAIKFLKKYKWKEENKKIVGVTFEAGVYYYAELKRRGANPKKLK